MRLTRVLRRAAAVVVLALLCGGLAVPAAAQTTLPGGMNRFVVSIGKVSASSRENWVRLANYSFTSTGQVTESHWHWTQRERVSRSYTGNTASACVARNCNVQTGHGYQSTSAPDHLQGTYTVTGSVLHIDWGDIWEEWTVSQPVEGLAKLTYRANSFGATHGFGYGSTAAWSTRASMSQIAGASWDSMVHTYHLWKTTSANQPPYIDQGTGSPFWYRDYTVCGGSRCAAGQTSSSQYYIARANTTSTDRRDTLWHWRTANADGRGEYCYTGNSHVKPMMEIIDSAGVLHGWVGVEVSINQTSPSQGALGDDIGVFAIADV